MFRPSAEPPKPKSNTREQDSGRFNSSRWAINLIIGINILVWFGWVRSIWALFMNFALTPNAVEDVKRLTEETKDKIEQNSVKLELPALQKFSEMQQMMDHTTLSWANIKAHRPRTILTHAFSQFHPLHQIGNMVALKLFARGIDTVGGAGIGAAHVMCMAVSGAIFSGSSDLAYKWWSVKERERTAMGASAVVMTFAVAGSCLTPLMSVWRFRLPSFRLMLTILSLCSDVVKFNDDDKVAHQGHLAGAVWGAVYYLRYLRKPRAVV